MKGFKYFISTRLDYYSYPIAVFFVLVVLWIVLSIFYNDFSFKLGLSDYDYDSFGKALIQGVIYLYLVIVFIAISISSFSRGIEKLAELFFKDKNKYEGEDLKNEML